MADSTRFTTSVDVVKVDEDLGLVLGYAIVCMEDGEPYFDVQGDHIPEASMLKAATDFMLHSRTAGDMHENELPGIIVFAWPMTKDIAEAFDLEVSKTGLMIAMHPDDPEVLGKFRDGTYTGFSIGGKRVEEEVVDG